MKRWFASIALAGVAIAATGCASTQSKQGALIGEAIGAVSGALIGEDRAQQHARQHAAAPPPVAVQRTAPPIRVQRVESISSRPRNGSYELQVVTAPSGEKYERRVRVPNR